MPSEVQEPQRLDVSLKRIALARLPMALGVLDHQRLDLLLGLALEEIGDAARQMLAVAMHEQQRAALVAADGDGAARSRLVDDEMRARRAAGS